MAGTMQSGGKGRAAPITGINVTPMVDVVLVLLVIMMVSAIYIVSQSLKVELPKTASSDGAANTPLSVTVTKAGAYLFNQKPIEEGRLRVEFKKAKPPKQQPRPTERPARAPGRNVRPLAAATPAAEAAAATGPVAFQDIGLALDSSSSDGIAVNVAPKPTAAPVVAMTPVKPKVLVA